MKKIALKSVALLLFVSVSLISCSKDDSGETIILANQFATAVTGPDSGAVDQDIELAVKFLPDNSCGQFNRFIETTSGSSKTIEVQVKYSGNNCGGNGVETTVPYKFRVNQAGTYTFKFKRSASQFITKVVTVE